MARETIMIDGVRYYADRPQCCRGCFFWKNRKVGCTLKKENCYYWRSPRSRHPLVQAAVTVLCQFLYEEMYERGPRNPDGGTGKCVRMEV